MARVPDDELQRIKSQVTVEDLCRDYGIELTRMGLDNLMGRCPFHDDHTPSFGVTPSKNLWNCLAGCGGGDVIELVVRKQNVSFRQAVDILRQRLGDTARRPDHRDAQPHHAPDAGAGLGDRTGRPRAAQARPRLLPPDLL
jgi:DNA primase